MINPRHDSYSSRRVFLRSIGAIGLTALAPRAFAGEDEFAALRCTPLFVNAGPYYPAIDQLPWASDLTRVPGKTGQAQGQILYIIGKITDVRCDTMTDTRVELWQADINGHYDHPVDRKISKQPLDPNFRYFGHVVTQADGYYLFKTIVPKWYEVFGYKRCAHIHFRIKHPEHGEVTTQMMFEGKEDDAIRKEDIIFQGIPDHIKPRVVVAKKKPSQFPELAARLKMEPDALVCRFDQALI